MVRLLKNFGLIILIIPNIFQCTPFIFGMRTQDKTKLTECIVKIIENIERKIFKISILTSEDDNILLTEMLRRVKRPVIINAAEYPQEGTDSRVHSDLVIIYNIDVQHALREVIWHRYTKFFIVYGVGKDMEDDFRKFWEVKLTNVFGLVNHSNEVHLFSYLPYERPNCNDAKPVLLDIWKGEEFSGDGWSAVNEDVRVKNANGCPMNVSVMYVRPMVLFPKNCKCNTSKEVDGIEARLVKVFAEVLNFTATYSKPRDGLGWGKIRPPIGVVGEVFRRESEFGFGMLAPLMERHENIDLSRNYAGRECITFSVPVGAGLEYQPWFANIKSGFSQLQFFLIFMSLLAVSFLVCMGGGLMPISAFIYTVTLFIGQTLPLPKRSTLKNLMLLWVLFSSIVTRIYEASMGSRMTVPSKPPDITTFEELRKSSLKFCGYPNMLDALRVGRGNPALDMIKERFLITDFDVDTAVDKMMHDRDIAYISHLTTLSYAVLTKPEARGQVIPLAQCAYDYYPAIALQRNSPFTVTVDGIVRALFESGISQHWRSLFLYEIPEFLPEVEAVHLEKSLGVFVILCVGYLVALVSFLVELGAGFVKSIIATRKRKWTRRRANHGQIYTVRKKKTLL